MNHALVSEVRRVIWVMALVAEIRRSQHEKPRVRPCDMLAGRSHISFRGAALWQPQESGFAMPTW